MHLFDSDTLVKLAQRKTLLAFDFDGTLAPIVDDPDAARMGDPTRHLLQQAAQLYPVAIVSGRSSADLQARLCGVTVWAILGNHGLEPHDGEERCELEVRRWMPKLREALRDVPGVTLDDKRLTVAVHYRKAEDEAFALRAIHRVASLLNGARVVGGKKVVNLIPEGAPHKGHGVEQFLQRFSCEAALYVGDDETDEDVFAVGPPRVFGVRVEASPSSRASYHLRGQAEIDELLERLIALRAPDAEPSGWEHVERSRR